METNLTPLYDLPLYTELNHGTPGPLALAQRCELLSEILLDSEGLAEAHSVLRGMLAYLDTLHYQLLVSMSAPGNTTEGEHAADKTQENADRDPAMASTTAIPIGDAILVLPEPGWQPETASLCHYCATLASQLLLLPRNSSGEHVSGLVGLLYELVALLVQELRATEPVPA
ncbi:hypothetical protein [Mangrovibacter plantisponsor]|uniref:Uncharacterized protein n=1 Tax=Mangrovibacter plantisponsor TaxID=451513 RepID=A0A317Q7T9_9ENTR|nr:hypothetical protein [Mangrovibacter plantisponsor]PWW11562.1 hypothetical protein DES37_102169 [Mangrovibacter plantisponsor]